MARLKRSEPFVCSKGGCKPGAHFVYYGPNFFFVSPFLRLSSRLEDITTSLPCMGGIFVFALGNVHLMKFLLLFLLK